MKEFPTPKVSLMTLTLTLNRITWHTDV